MLLNDYHIYFKHTSYKIGTQFIFRGTNILGIPKGVKAILNGTGKLRLYDRTNSNVIFEWDSIDHNDWQIATKATGINWPTGEAILELQSAELSECNKNLYVSCFMVAANFLFTETYACQSSRSNLQ